MKRGLGISGPSIYKIGVIFKLWGGGGTVWNMKTLILAQRLEVMIMPSTLKKLKGYIALGSSVHVSIQKKLS